MCTVCTQFLEQCSCRSYRQEHPRIHYNYVLCILLNNLHTSNLLLFVVAILGVVRAELELVVGGGGRWCWDINFSASFARLAVLSSGTTEIRN